ncbi:hypothetical protein DUQ00_22175 [Salmonella bongori]|jgi:type IV secretion system protein VirB10|uniref:TrbI/VirB10 family protein n=1 Tax=Salmonella muenchen TaxID=596 RepID=A0A5W3IR54_SALMU|nr:type IV secretion system protein VirB10 [Salmonella enterica]EBS5600566.1 hypothetical protein [Salmonella enterica subsp. enterica serovar Monschaui]EBW6611856.1 hypothetical protein [Salmonella enterica subsp. enterica serovar Muenchen]ECB6235026.1 hypothetical protein [Salmonella enterica subsp. enterica serovar Minnesota]ECC9598947.1 hypothetical protein [Salmonella bongori]EIM5291246.1 type IV secretion system protein VirB10 [Salmonella enterica subsp. enterica serovar Ealing]EJQ04141
MSDLKNKFIFRSRKKKEDEPEKNVDGERSIPSVNKTMDFQGKLTKWVIFIASMGVAGLLFYNFYADNLAPKKQKSADEAGEEVTGGNTSIRPLQTPTLPPEFTEEKTPPVAPREKPPLPTASQQNLDANGKPVLTREEIILKRREDAPVAFSSRSSRNGASSGSSSSQVVTPEMAQAGTAGADSPMLGAGNTGGDEFTSNLKPVNLASMKASYMGNTDLLLEAGREIKCTQFEAIDSTLPGQVSCIGSEDVWSESQNVLLMEKGTRYLGIIRKGLANGQKRLFVMWYEARTPKKVRVPLLSGGGDSLGRSGLDGYVSTHFWERFGAAILISVIDDTGTYLANRGMSNDGQTNINFGNTAQAGGEVTSEVLKQTANIPPTLLRNQGSRVYIHVARDVDFSDVYSLEPTR